MIPFCGGELSENRYSEGHTLQTDVYEIVPYSLHFSFDLDEAGSKKYLSSCEFCANRRSVLAGVNQFRIYPYFPNVLSNLGDQVGVTYFMYNLSN